MDLGTEPSGRWHLGSVGPSYAFKSSVGDGREEMRIAPGVTES